MWNFPHVNRYREFSSTGHWRDKRLDSRPKLRNLDENETGTRPVHDAPYNDLAEIKKLAMVCEDCGRRIIWGVEQIARAQVRWRVRTAVQLGSRLACKRCAEVGQAGHNVSIYVDPIEEAQPATLPPLIAGIAS